MEYDDKTVSEADDSAVTTDPAGRHGSAKTDGGSEALVQILDELRAIRREQQHQEFSFWQLAGAMAQALALCAIGWGGYAMLEEELDKATIRLLAGIAFQLMALTGFSAPRKS